MLRRLVRLLSLLLMAQLLLPPGLAVTDAAPAPSEPPLLATPLPSGRPRLDLAWSTRDAQAGVPVTLTIRALDAAGRPQPDLAGTALVTVHDARADLGGAVGTPFAGGQQVRLALRGGEGRLDVTFRTPGPHGADAALAGSPELAGANDRLLVHPTRLVVQGPATATQDVAQPYTVSAQDEAGRAVDGYIGALVVTTSDARASVQDAATGRADARDRTGRRLGGGEHGQAALTVTFAQVGAQTVTVAEADHVAGEAGLTVTVQAAPAIRRATATPAAGPRPMSCLPAASTLASPEGGITTIGTCGVTATPTAVACPRPAATSVMTAPAGAGGPAQCGTAVPATETSTATRAPTPTSTTMPAPTATGAWPTAHATVALPAPCGAAETAPTPVVAPGTTPPAVVATASVRCGGTPTAMPTAIPTLTAVPSTAPVASAMPSATATSTAGDAPPPMALGATAPGRLGSRLGGLLFWGGRRAPAAFSQVASYATTILADGPVGYWRLGESGGSMAADSSGKGNNGQYHGGTALGVPGALLADENTAVRFDGATGYVGIPDAPSLDSSGAISVEAWVNSSVAGSDMVIARKEPASSLQKYSDDRFEFSVFVGGVWRGVRGLPGGTTAATNTWYHVVGVYDNGVISVYVNGILDRQAALTGAVSTTTDQFTIGSFRGTGYFWNGAIDEVAVYSTALTAARVQAHYQAGIGDTPPASLSATTSTATTDAGVPLTLTVQAHRADGSPDTGYVGTVQLSSTDPVFAPGGAYRYPFTTADAGQHTFPLTFNTAGSAQTVTVADTAQVGLSATSPAVQVAETILTASVPPGAVQLGAAVTLTVQARDASGALVAGYRGTVVLSSTWNSAVNFGAGVSGSNTYPFAAADAGSHTFTPDFRTAGTQTVTVADAALATRSAGTAPIPVAGGPAGGYQHDAAPAGVLVPGGGVLWAFVGAQGHLYVRRSVGSLTDPAWTSAPLLVRPVIQSGIGADSPSLVVLGSTIALFHTYSDGTHYQVWLTTSTDLGQTWSAPSKRSSELANVAHVQAVVVGGTVSLFWSRQDSDRQVSVATSTDLVTWSAPVTLGQVIGMPLDNTSSTFAVAHLASGRWLLGWQWVSQIYQYGAGNSTNYPTTQVATSADLVSWTSPVELQAPWDDRWPLSVSLAQEPGSGTIYAMFERTWYPWDKYVVQRTSTDGVTWGAQTTAYFEHALPGNGLGWAGYRAVLPALVPTGSGQMQSAAAESLCYGDSGPCYGGFDWGNPASVEGIGFVDPHLLAEPLLMALGAAPLTVACPTGRCKLFNHPIDAATGYESTSATDLSVPVLGGVLAVTRSYLSADGLSGRDSPFGVGWHWQYDVAAVTLADGSVAIIEANGRRALFWKTGRSWTPDAAVNATLAAGGGGGYVLTRKDQSVWTFTANGQLASLADRNGNVQSLSYTGGRLSSVAAPGGRTLTVTSDGSGHLTRLAGPGGLAVAYAYDGSGNLTSVTDASGAVTTYSYDGQHQVLTIVDADRHTAETNSYGALGRVTRQTDAAGGATTFGYALPTSPGGGGQTTVVDALGNQTVISYDTTWRLSERDAYQGTGGGATLVAKWTWTYDQNNDIASMTDEDGIVTAFTYDANANVLTKTLDPSGLNLRWASTYNALNEPLAATDPLGHVTSSTYDARGNRLTVTDALGQVTTSAYDGAGQRTSVTDANHHATTMGYSPAGDVTTLTAPDSTVTTLAYDAAGRLTSGTDALSHARTLTYDDDGRLLSVTDALATRRVPSTTRPATAPR